MKFFETLLSGLKAIILSHSYSKAESDQRYGQNERSDWNENDKSSYAYIKNRPFYEALKETVIVDNLTFADYNNGNIPGLTFVVGQSYNVTWNGKLYEGLICYNYSGYRAIAGSDMGYPFYIDDSGGNGLWIASADNNWTVSITTVQSTVQKIPLKYLPEMSSVGKEVSAEGAEIFNDYNNNQALGLYSHAEGYCTAAEGDYSHTEGQNSLAEGITSHAEGYNTIAKGGYSHAEGYSTAAEGHYSHAEGCHTYAEGDSSHSEGYSTIARGDYSHAEGYFSTAHGMYSHAQGRYTIANMPNQNVIGKYNVGESFFEQDVTQAIHAMPSTTSALGYKLTGVTFDADNGRYVAETISDFKIRVSQFQVGDLYLFSSNDTKNITEYYEVTSISSNKTTVTSKRYSIFSGRYAHIVGNGNSDSDRSNAHTLDWNGNAWFAGKVYVGGTSQDDASSLATKEDVKFLNSVGRFCIPIDDSITGRQYYLTIRNGQLATQSAVVALEITKLPDKLDYIKGEFLVPDGMVVVATYEDGTTEELPLAPWVDSVPITGETSRLSYEQGNNVISIIFNVNIIPMDEALIDFEYTVNDNGTYTITAWRGTLNGEPSTEMVVPNSSLIYI